MSYSLGSLDERHNFNIFLKSFLGLLAHAHPGIIQLKVNLSLWSPFCYSYRFVIWWNILLRLSRLHIRQRHGTHCQRRTEESLETSRLVF